MSPVIAVRAAVLAVILVAASGCSGSEPSHPTVTASAQVSRAPAAPSCPAGRICLFSLADFKGQTEQITPIEFRSHWDSLETDVGFQVMSGVDHSNSTIWLWDPHTQAYGAICGSQAGNALDTSVPFVDFFIQFNVADSCLGKAPPGAPGSQ